MNRRQIRRQAHKQRIAKRDATKQAKRFTYFALYGISKATEAMRDIARAFAGFPK